MVDSRRIHQTGFKRVGEEKVWTNGRRLASPEINVAIKDRAVLASEPLQLAVDRFGKNVKEGEADAKMVPWSSVDAQGPQTARAPHCWEEFEARYRYMDAQMWRKYVEITTPEFHAAAHTKLFKERELQDSSRVIQTFAWAGEEGNELRGGKPAAIMLIGVEELSLRSRQLAGRAVVEAAPSALLVQLCRERAGRYLVMPEEHMRAAADYQRGYASGNPRGLRAWNFWDAQIKGDQEALEMWYSNVAYGVAASEFAKLPSSGPVPKTLCLGDVLSSRMEALRLQREEAGAKVMKDPAAMSARSRQLVRGLMALAHMGHQTVLGVVDQTQLPTMVTWLERAGARLVAVADATDIEAGRETIAGDIRLALESTGGPKNVLPASMSLGFGRSRLGDFLNQRGMDVIQKRQELLKRVTRVQDLVKHVEPLKEWKVAQLIGGEGGTTPGPMAMIEKRPIGTRFEHDMLMIPDAYMRDAGIGVHGRALWQQLERGGGALTTKDTMELDLWSANPGGAQSWGAGWSDDPSLQLDPSAPPVSASDDPSPPGGPISFDDLTFPKGSPFSDAAGDAWR